MRSPPRPHRLPGTLVAFLAAACVLPAGASLALPGLTPGGAAGATAQADRPAAGTPGDEPRAEHGRGDASAADDASRDDGWGDEGWGDEGWNDSGNESGWDSPWGETRSRWTGFLELAAGARVEENPPLDRRWTLQDLRLRLENSWRPAAVELSLKAELELDGVVDSVRLDVREAALALSPGGRLDLKVGRQVLTWGTGDLIFLNDLFPKDFQSFFAGRDDEYLKAPSDSVRLTRYGDPFNVDLAWSPEFEPDRYLTGERFSFFLPGAEAVVAPDQGRVPAPDDFPEDGELAVRLFDTAGGVEYAAYGYRGFFKAPLATFPATGPPVVLRFFALNVFGASVRAPLGAGLFNAELAWYDSRDAALDPAAPRDQWRLLLGYERELVPRLTLGLQASVEHVPDHDEVLAAAPDPATAIDETRGVVTARLTHRALRDRLTSSLFVFASPTDEDWHLRPRLDYRYSDAWRFTAGANLFGGEDDFTFFGQLDGNDNVYVRARLSF